MSENPPLPQKKDLELHIFIKRGSANAYKSSSRPDVTLKTLPDLYGALRLPNLNACSQPDIEAAFQLAKYDLDRKVLSRSDFDRAKNAYNVLRKVRAG